MCLKQMFVGLGLLLVLSSPLFAIGTITAATGSVTVERTDNQIAASSGFKLQQKDIIRTADDARAQLRFKDGTVITMGRESELDIQTFLYDEANAAKSEVRFGAAKGALRAVTGQVGRANPDRFKMQTRTATIGIRGTQFLMNIQPENETIACTQGAIVVESEGGSVEVPAGQLTRAQAGQPPTPPVPYTPEEVESLASEAGGGGEVIDPDEVVIEEEGEDVDPASQEPAEEEAAEEEEEISSTEPEEEPEEELAFREILEEEPEEIDPAELPDLNLYSEDLTYTRTRQVLHTAGSVTGEPPSHTGTNPSDHQMALEGEDPYTSWGFWVSEPTGDPTPEQIVKGYVSGDLSPESTIAHLMEIEQVYSYGGSVEGTVDQAHRMQNGQFDMSIHFGSSDPIRGDIRFDAGSDHWHIGVSGGEVASSGYHTDGLSAGANSDVTIDSGRLQGRFYGPGAESTGGSFSASGSGGEAEGIFKGGRQ
jgi:hypothetical protein